MKARVWDLPLRLCHWLLVAALIGAVITGKLGGPLLDWHARCGGLIMGLVIFRVVWGFIGSHHARFVSFFPTRVRLRSYLRGTWQGLGHNPLGALSVFALLAALLAQVGTGVFATDDSDFNGPLYGWVSLAASQRLTYWHVIGVDLLVVLTGLHVAAIAYHAWVRKTNLVLPMLTGSKSVTHLHADSRLEPASVWRAIAAGLLAYAIVAGVFNLPPRIDADAAAAAPPAPAANW